MEWHALTRWRHLFPRIWVS